MFKKLFTYVMAFLVATSPLQAYASDLGNAFSNLMGSGSAATVTAPGRYTSGARNIFVGGGVEMRFPRSNVSLFSIAPPSFSAGCQGISAHFGGFSFISGKEIEQLVRNIAQGAPGMVINLVIKTLCPMCEAVLQNMQHLAQFAAKVNIDSCRVAGNLATMLVDKLKPTSAEGSQAVAGACGLRESAIGNTSEWGQANEGVCNTLKGSVAALDKQWKDIENGLYGAGGDVAAPKAKQDTSAERCGLGIGNCTWLVLAQIFEATDKVASNEVIKNRLLMMNLMGATLMGEGVTCGSAADATAGGAPSSLMCLPKLEAKDVIALFMCGRPSGDTSVQKTQAQGQVWSAYCSDMFARKDGDGKLVAQKIGDVVTAIDSMPLMDCDLLPDDQAANANAYDQCKTLKQSTVGEMKLIDGNGFLYEVQALLTEAVTRVRENRAMGKDEQGRRIIALINMAPYPLYQAINAAAVYPEAGQSLMDSMTLLVADHIAYAYLQKMLQLTAARSYAGVTISPKMVNKVLDGMQNLRMESDRNRSRMGKTIASQQLMMEEIRKVNLVIQQSVMTEEMLNMQKYANTVNTSAAEPSTTGK